MTSSSRRARRAIFALAVAGAVGVSGLIQAPATAAPVVDESVVASQPDAGIAAQPGAEIAAPAGEIGASWGRTIGYTHYNHVAEVRMPSGEVFVVAADQDGYLTAVDGFGNQKWKVAIDPAAGNRAGSDSSPAVGDLDGDGVPEIVVGAGEHGPHAELAQGGVVAVRADGSVMWRYQTRDRFSTRNDAQGPDGYTEGVIGTPVIGDVDGDGLNDVVFGGLDHRVYALNGQGQLVTAPYDNHDTVFSSPALVNIDNDAALEIIIGGDGTPTPGMTGWSHRGYVNALDVTPNGLQLKWRSGFQDVVGSTIVVADINNDGRPEALFTTGEYYFGEHDRKVWAVDALTGATVPGWPVQADAKMRGNVSVGDVIPGGTPEVVFGDYLGGIYVYNAQGQRAWKGYLDGKQQLGPGYGMHYSGVTIADYDGDGDQDLFVASGWGGASVYDVRSNTRIAYRLGGFHNGMHWPMATQPTIVDFGAGRGGRQMVGQGYSDVTKTGRLYGAPLTAVSRPDAWPTWNGNAARNAAPVTDRPAENYHVAKALYIHMLGRPGSDAERQGWGRLIAQRGPAFVSSGFMDSTEYRSLRIRYFYTNVLGRKSVSQEEVMHHVRRGGRLDDIPREFMESPEFYLNAGGTDAGFINELYLRGIGRNAAPNEIAGWTPILQSQGRGVLINAIYNSPESARSRVNSAYQLWLGRSAQPAEQAHWEQAVLTQGDEGMRHNIMVSLEYALKARNVQP